MNIRKIRIENIRGFKSKELFVDVRPNTPNFFVAPNGFGKTSIATAFKSLKQTGLSVADEDKYMNSTLNEPLLQLEDDSGNVYTANLEINTISNIFSTFVINSQVKPKASSRLFGGFSTATSSLIVEPIVICNSIPNSAEFEYSFTDMKNFFGLSFGKLLCNLSRNFKTAKFVKIVENNKNDFLKLGQTRNSQQINAFVKLINSFSGTKKEILEKGIDLSVIKSNDTIRKLYNEYSDTFIGFSELEVVINLIQIGKVVNDNRNELSHIFKYYNYLGRKQSIDEMLSLFNCTWKNIRASQQDGKLLIKFPKANQISNGERDVLCFISKLFEAESKLTKEHSILIIDEIFDYLDDANLIATQYFLTKFINMYKSEGREFYPIILTHLDPTYFNTYSFSTKNVNYLFEGHTITNKYKINELLKDRDNCKKQDKVIYDSISTYYLHYSPNVVDESEYLRALRVEEPLFTSDSFQVAALDELRKYMNHENYDAALTCCGLRIYIEKQIYEKLPAEYQDEYVNRHKTLDKLTFAKEKDVDVPEVYFLLSIIYNEALHLDSQCKKLKPIECKLKNKVIQKMISEI